MMITQLERPFIDASEDEAALFRRQGSKVGTALLTIIQSAMDGVIIVDATRQIILINQKAEKMFGYPVKQLLGKSIDILLSPRVSTEQKRRLEHIVNTRTSGRRTRIGLKAVHASGQEFSVNANLSRVTAKGEMFLVVMLRDMAKQAVPDKKHRCMKSSELRKLAVSSQQTNEVEKRRFSKELYDDIGQRLSVLKLDLDWLENSLSDNKAVVPARVAQMQGLLDNVIMMTKSMASTLRPPLLDDFGLMPAVEWMTDNFQKKTSIACELVDNGMPGRLAEPIESAVFRVIQEALANIERHARAHHVRITLGQGDQHLDLHIEDDGIGLNGDSSGKAGSHGLIAMQERIFILGGTITIRNMAPRGVAIHASIPIDAVPA
jgi:PAS domain S-box-containing protein